MKPPRRCLSILIILVLALSVPLSGGAVLAEDGFTIGNTDLNIRNGGVMLKGGGDFYYSEGGQIFRENETGVAVISWEPGRNLNLSGGYLYYTAGGSVRRLPAAGGAAETIYTHTAYIDQLYIVRDSELRFVSGGSVYSRRLSGGQAERLYESTGVKGLIPTKYGDILLTGELFDYTVCAGDKAVVSGVTGCYTDSGYLVLNIAHADYQIRLDKLFSGFGAAALEEFSLHADEDTVLMGTGGEQHICQECEENAHDAVPLEASQALVSLLEDDGVFKAPELSEGQKNIVKRARQLHEIVWTPLEDRYQWGYRGVFTAETTYQGAPYGQPVNTGYMGYTVTLSQWLAATNDNTSKFYTGYSEYNRIAPYYSTDCSGFVSYAWGLKVRSTTYSIPQVAERVSDQSIYSIQVGDCLNRSDHVVLVTAVRYDDAGNITSIDITEQTPVITKYTRYGEGGTYELSRLQSYYLNGGYVIYRNPNRDSVSYTHDCAVPIDGDYCPNCKTTVPKTSTTAIAGGKSVRLSHPDGSAVIYYTTDGSAPTASSKRYDGESIYFYDSGRLRAIAVTPQFSGSTVLEYTVKIVPAAAPEISVSSGEHSGSTVASGSTIELKSATANAVIYYTTDGSAPTTQSMRYTGPFAVTQDITVRAVAVCDGFKDSPVSSSSFRIGALYPVTVTYGAGGGVSPEGQVNVLEGGSKTFAITPKSGYVIDTVTVDGVSVGAVSSYTLSNVTGPRSIHATFKTAGSHPFTDVLSTDWHNGAVSFAYSQGLFAGTSATTFSPNNPMTRGMFVTVLGRYAGVSSELQAGCGVVSGGDVRIRSGPSTSHDILAVCAKYTTVQVLGQSGDWYQVKHGQITGYIRNDLLKVYSNTFADLPGDAYYRAYVEWAYLSGIASGASGAVFSPDVDITREQMCVMFYNYASGYGVKLPSNIAKETFNDDAQISDGAREAVYALQSMGVISGKGGGIFDPQGSATRAEVAQIFRNFVTALS